MQMAFNNPNAVGSLKWFILNLETLISVVTRVRFYKMYRIINLKINQIFMISSLNKYYVNVRNHKVSKFVSQTIIVLMQS